MIEQDYRKLQLNGRVFIKYYDEKSPFIKGDLLLYLYNDTTSPIIGDYENSNFSGYFKAKVYDGRNWHLVNLEEFFDHREYKYPKKQIPLNTALLCQELLIKFKGMTLHRTYRDHFTTHEYKPNDYITKANRNRK